MPTSIRTGRRRRRRSPGCPSGIARDIVWYIDGQPVGKTHTGIGRIPWRLQRGEHVARARVRPLDDDAPVDTPEVTFNVK